MPGIQDMAHLIEALDSPYISVHQQRCIMVRDRNVTCLRCAEVCTSGCIRFDADSELLEISPELCIGCGTCATECPTCALDAHHPDDDAFLASCVQAANASSGRVAVTCAPLFTRAQGLIDEERVVCVECLGRIEESALAYLESQDIEVRLVHGPCDGCERSTGRAMVERVLESFGVVMDAWNREPRVSLSAKFPAYARKGAEEFDKSKRLALSRGFQEAKHAGAITADLTVREMLGAPLPENMRQDKENRYVKVSDDGTLTHFVPARRKRLLSALASIGEPLDEMIDTRLWGHVVIDCDTCTTCRMCAVFCPTGALRKFDNPDGSFGVSHYPGECVKCRLCEKICPAHALEISNEVFAVDMLAGLVESYDMGVVEKPREGRKPYCKVEGLFDNTDSVYEVG